jgi:hypothetical protein
MTKKSRKDEWIAASAKFRKGEVPAEPFFASKATRTSLRLQKDAVVTFSNCPPSPAQVVFMRFSPKSSSRLPSPILFIKKSLSHNSLPYNALQLDFSRKIKYFLKLDHAIDYTRVYENGEKKDENIQIAHPNK